MQRCPPHLPPEQRPGETGRSARITIWPKEGHKKTGPLPRPCFFLDRRSSNAACQRVEAVWDGDSLDWKEISAQEIVQRVTGKVQPGSIVLFHNAALHTPEALPQILETLLREGYTFVPISQLLLPGAYEIDHTGRQITSQETGMG